MSQDNWIKLDEKPAVMGWNFDLKGTSINGNKKLNKIELTQEDLDKINNSDQIGFPRNGGGKITDKTNYSVLP